MKIHSFFLMLLFVLLTQGCATDSVNQSVRQPARSEPKHTQRVQVAMYDESPRQASDHLDIYDETRLIQRVHKDIALLTCEGTPGEEGEMTEAIIYRARLMGAEALIILPPSRSGWGDRRVFRAKAVAYQPSPK